MGIMMKKDVVAGLGEIGLPILKILSKKEKIGTCQFKKQDDDPILTILGRLVNYTMHYNYIFFKIRC